jgi:hypothetical protein
MIGYSLANLGSGTAAKVLGLRRPGHSRRPQFFSGSFPIETRETFQRRRQRKPLLRHGTILQATLQAAGFRLAGQVLALAVLHAPHGLTARIATI